MVETVIDLLNNHGTTGILYVGFCLLIIWLVKKYDKNEERLYKVIDVLGEKLQAIDDIKNKLNEISSELNRGK